LLIELILLLSSTFYIFHSQRLILGFLSGYKAKNGKSKKETQQLESFSYLGSLVISDGGKVTDEKY